MATLPYDLIIARIKEQSSIPEAELQTKIRQKIDSLSGLISKEGAAHIVANELGVKLFEQGKVKIKDVLPNMRSVETYGRVMKLFPLVEFESSGRPGKVMNMQIADETGSLRVVFWHDAAENAKLLQEGNILGLKNAYAKVNRGYTELHTNAQSVVIRNPPGIEVSVAPQPVSERKQITALTPNDTFVEVLGSVIQIFDLRFFEVCPTCKKRAVQKENGFVCATHGVVVPAFSSVLNLVLDDGTGTLRVVCFSRQIEQLLSKTSQQLLQFKENPILYEEAKIALLGTFVKVTGRINHNSMFDRLELVSNVVVTNPNPGDELKRLAETQPAAAPAQSHTSGNAQPAAVADEQLDVDEEVVESKWY
ncbi:hypothetical protein HZB02_04165 [Candidatus Woesearchaeota archaeon]|nr:hypothetical protein [Candidatus Woesearchaeota archaeon]